MKKKLLYFVLLLTLMFVSACGSKEDKEDKKTESTDSLDATPTQANLAMAALESLESTYNTSVKTASTSTVDYSKGVGYDMNLEVALSEDIGTLLGVTDLESIALRGTMDIKDAVASNLRLALNNADLLEFDLFADTKDIFFNLPKYSDSYALCSFEELFGVSAEDFASAFSASMEGMPTTEELTKIYTGFISDFVHCFVPTEIEENVSIGIEGYTITADKHTVMANAENIITILNKFMEDLGQYEAITTTMEELDPADYTNSDILLSYYVKDDKEFAWELCIINGDESYSIVFVNTENGFCLYNTDTKEPLIYSEATSKTSGIITLVDEEEITFDYTIDGNKYSVSFENDDVAFEISFVVKNTSVDVAFEVTSEGVTLTGDISSDTDKFAMNMGVEAFGVSFGSLSVEMALRDYKESKAPANAVDLDTWTTGLDQMALMTDLFQLMEDYPFLEDLILGTSTGDDYDSAIGDTYVPDADYTDPFMNMTGYTMDETGYVDFEPLEEEVLAIGKPSTGMDAMAITDAQKQAMFDYAADVIDNCYEDTASYYFVFGSTRYNSVESFYSTDYVFGDENNYINSIEFGFDAVSGELASISVYNESKETALQIINDLLEILKIDYVLTAEAAENYTFTHDLSFSGYDGGDYYSVGFDVYYE